MTICTRGKSCIFGYVKNAQMNLNHPGKIAEQCLLETPDHIPNSEIFESIVMPNHIHAIVLLHEIEDDEKTGKACHAPTGGVFGKPKPRSISTIVGSYKSAVAKIINMQFPNLYKNVWQRGFFERVIRDEKELRAIVDYIKSNPANWEKDENYFL